MSRRLTVASEVDAYCTKCKLDLGHRIIAMVGDVIKKVESYGSSPAGRTKAKIVIADCGELKDDK